MVTTPTIIQAIEDQRLFGPWFKTPDTWTGWMAYLKALFALPMTETERQIYQKCTGRNRLPENPLNESWLIVGRRGGKSFIVSLVAVYLSCFRDYSTYLAPGERPVVMVLAADRKQARVVFNYIRAFIQNVPMLARMIERETAEGIDLSNGVSIEVHTTNFRAVRGYTAAAVLLDEVAFWRSEYSVSPDTEIVSALRPAMATIPGSILIGFSSPYARRGVLWEAHRDNFGKDGPILVFQADSRTMNPTLSEQVIQEAYERDPISAASEYGGEFRRDIENFISTEALQNCVITGRRELPPALGLRYQGFVDPSGGSQDSMTLAISHRQGEQVILDCIRERRPPFSPENVVEEFATLLKNYGVSRISGDRYAGEWPRERFQKHGIVYEPSEKTRSELYLELLPLLNGGRVELLDDRTLLHQLQNLERRTGSGRDSIDHCPCGHDDVANAAAGAVYLCAKGVRPMTVQELRNGSFTGNPMSATRQLKENSSWSSLADSGQDYVRTPNNKWDW